MGVAIGSSIQIALFVTPLLVILGWMLGQPMDLHFETCGYHRQDRDFSILTSVAVETVAFALSVLVVIYTVTDGKSNYLEGAMVSSLSQGCHASMRIKVC